MLVIIVFNYWFFVESKERRKKTRKLKKIVKGGLICPQFSKKSWFRPSFGFQSGKCWFLKRILMRFFYCLPYIADTEYYIPIAVCINDGFSYGFLHREIQSYYFCIQNLTYTVCMYIVHNMCDGYIHASIHFGHYSQVFENPWINIFQNCLCDSFKAIVHN